ncbi:MAG: LapA family protein [Gammaproteobacteria bacterium]|nr:LapA family protein [Gammaproteobacteria bacterium]
MKKIFYLIVLTIVVVFGLTFTLENPQGVDVSYYFGLHWSGPLSLLLVFTAGVGAVIGFLSSLGLVVRVQRRLAQAKREIQKAEQEVTNLRALPIKDAV